jgi:hypothetical protein
MNYVVNEILRPAAGKRFSSLTKQGYVMRHCVGISSSAVPVVRAGVRNNNDRVFVGSAPNIAAKLSDMRESPYHTFVSHDVYKGMAAEAKISGDGTEYVALPIGVGRAGSE